MDREINMMHNEDATRLSVITTVLGMSYKVVSMDEREWKIFGEFCIWARFSTFSGAGVSSLFLLVIRTSETAS